MSECAWRAPAVVKKKGHPCGVASPARKTKSAYQLLRKGDFNAVPPLVEDVQPRVRHVAGCGLRYRDFLSHELQAAHLRRALIAKKIHVHFPRLTYPPTTPCSLLQRVNVVARLHEQDGRKLQHIQPRLDELWIADERVYSAIDLLHHPVFPLLGGYAGTKYSAANASLVEKRLEPGRSVASAGVRGVHQCATTSCSLPSYSFQ